MKTILLFAALCVSITVSAQDMDIPVSEVPGVVLKTFKSKFATATATEWERKSDQYQAEFKIGRVDHKARFDENGRLTAMKKDIRPSELPVAVQRAVKDQFKDYRIDDAERVERGGKVTYQVELDGAPQDEKIIFNKDGKRDDKHPWW
ncbi:PepSY-like domain-containing protein [Chitinophaga lutea]